MTIYPYDFRIDLAADNSHTRILRLVGTGKRVLELGCATGYMSRILVEQLKCEVTGIERDAAAADEARKICGRVIVGDLETLDYGQELAEERFDLILCADVLEHLRDPVAVLRALPPYLAPTGSVIASVPNVAHAAVIAELLDGRFPYAPLGLLDETHLRFFTRDTLYACFEQAGFAITHLERLQKEPSATEFRTDLSRFSLDVRRALCAHEESTTYQFILAARPAPEGQLAALADRLAEVKKARPEGPVDSPVAAGAGAAAEPDTASFWRARATALIDAIVGRMAHLDTERGRHVQAIQDLETRLADLRSRLGHFEPHSRNLEALLEEARARIHTLEADAGALDAHVRALEAHAGALDAHVRALEAHLTDLTSGRAWRLARRLQQARLVVCPPGSRRERAYRTLFRRLTSLG